MLHSYRIAALPVAAAAIFSPPAAATDWPQFGYDVAHSSFNRAEAGYSTAAGNTILRHYALNAALGGVDSAPVYAAGVATASGARNLLFVETLNGTIAALDADSAELTVVWSQQPAGAGNVNTGSPAVDPGRQYVYAYGSDGQVHKYNIAAGVEATGGGWPEVSTLKPSVEKGAAGLSIATAANGTTYLYAVTDGYIGDQNDYQGHLTAVDLATGAQTVFNSACSTLTIHFVNGGVTSGVGQNDCASKQNGIWGRPGAVYDAGTDRVFITTGNGPYNASTGGFNWGDSVLALHPDGSGAGGGLPLDSYTPTTYANLQGTDADLGSESIAIVPPPSGTSAGFLHIAVQAGKDGCVRLINLANLSGQGAPAHTGGELQAVNFPNGHCATGTDSPEIKPQPAVWVNPVDGASWIYVASYSDGMIAYKVVLSSGTPSLAQQWTAASGSSPVVANGTLYYMSGNKLRALDAVTGAAKVTGGAWTTTSYTNQHWQSPIVVNGRVYLFDNASPANLWVYQLDGAFRSGFE